MSSKRYASFLLRLWREDGQQSASPAAAWQGEVEHIQTNQLSTFDTLDELLSFLHQQTEEASPAEPG